MEEIVKKMIQKTVKKTRMVEGGAVVDQPDHEGFTPGGIALEEWPLPFYLKVFGDLDGSTV
jgi:hypothetical protein